MVRGAWRAMVHGVAKNQTHRASSCTPKCPTILRSTAQVRPAAGRPDHPGLHLLVSFKGCEQSKTNIKEYVTHGLRNLKCLLTGLLRKSLLTHGAEKTKQNNNIIWHPS